MNRIPEKSGGLKAVYLLLGWLFVALGMLGVLLPVLPTTPFLLLALWAFSKSSERLHDRLYHHPRFGPPLQRWQEHRIIPRHAKWFIALAMSGNFLYLLNFTSVPSNIALIIGLIMLVVASYLLTRPSSLSPEKSVNE